MNPRQFSFLLTLMLPIFLGTTYVVKEGEIEVGKLIIHDGQDRVEVFEGDKPSAAIAGAEKAQPEKLLVSDSPRG